MDRETLNRLLRRLRIRANAYSLNGGLPDERYVLSAEKNGIWAVYGSERGERVAERRFTSEATACKYLLFLVLRDPSTRKSWNKKPGR
jgi:hypothetical protein